MAIVKDGEGGPLSLQAEDNRDTKSPIRILRDSGLKKTLGRVKILDVLLKTRRPLSGQEIVDKLGRDAMDPASIYRALNAFFERGIVHKIEGVDRVSRFALDRGDALHPHFSCRVCGKMECMSDVTIPVVEIGKKGFIVEGSSINVWGICSRCNNGF